MRNKTLCVVGLGYVGMPLAMAFSDHIKVIGYDIDSKKLECLKECNSQSFELASDPNRIREADYVLVCVPTPITQFKEPDLNYVRSAAEIIGENLKIGAIVVLESTVYPGVTEEILKPILEAKSGFVCGRDFKIGYSPERINPGDQEHTLDRIKKIVAGMDEDTTDALAELYGLVTDVYVAKDIRTAEAAKVIENIQRDLNIALMNELALIFVRMGLDMKSVLDAASTKWNFMNFTPGLVGGHCIPVDPYYLVHKAKELNYHPEVILAGRRVNDSMPNYVAELAIKGLNKIGKVINKSKILIMGLTYKENVPDTRSSPARDIVNALNEFSADVYGYDPFLTQKEIEDFKIKVYDNSTKIDCVIIAVTHDKFKEMGLMQIAGMMDVNPVIIDVRGLFEQDKLSVKNIYYRRL